MPDTEPQIRDRSTGPPRPLPELPDRPEPVQRRGQGTFTLTSTTATRTVGAPRSAIAQWTRRSPDARG